MTVIHELLDELQKRVESSVNPITDFESKKNELYEIDNMLFKYKINSKELTSEDISLFNKEDIKRLITIMDEGNSDVIYQKLLDNLDIVKVFNKIKGDYNVNFEAPQYKEATVWINDLVKRINNFIKTFEERNKEYMESLKKSLSMPKYYLDLFTDDILVKPITDIKAFRNLLDTFNFKPKEKAEIMKYIGKGNCSLVGPIKKVNSESNDKLNKYKLIFENKRQKYRELYELIENEEITLATADDMTELLSEHYKKPYEDVKQAVTCVLLNKSIKDYEDALVRPGIEEEFIKEYLDNITKEIEQALEFSRKERVIKEEPVKEEPKELTEEEKLVNTINEILSKEKEALALTDDKDYASKLSSSFNDKDLKAVLYKLSSVLIGLQGELLKLNETKDLKELKYAHDTALGNLREYLSAYQTLKEEEESLVPKEEPTEEKVEAPTETKTIFLTDANNEPFFFQNLDKVDSVYLKELDNVLERNIYPNNLNQIKTYEIGKQAKYYCTKSKDIRIAFMKAANDVNFVICSAIKSEDLKKKVNSIYDVYRYTINDLMNKAKDPVELQMIIDEQAKIREELKKKLIKEK